jgi:hypothetical protein
VREVNWNKLSAIAELISSVAIVFTLVYLVVQTQQNFTAIQANSRQVAISSDLQILATAFVDPIAILAQFKKEMTAEEATKLETWLIMLVRSREQQWLQYRDGLLDETTWNSYLSGLSGNLSTSNTRRWWENASSLFDPEFSAAVDDYLSSVPISDQRRERFIESAE